MSTDEKKTTKARTTRVSILRVGILVVVTAAVIGFGLMVFRPVVAPAAPPGDTGFAPYVDVTATPPYPFETPQGPNQQDVTLAFVVAGQDGCTPTWGGFYTLEQAADQLELDRRIAQLRSVGGNVRVSFGGQSNHELAVTCTDVAALEGAYRSVVERYELTSIDLDIEGPDLSDSAAQVRRSRGARDGGGHPRGVRLRGACCGGILRRGGPTDRWSGRATRPRWPAPCRLRG